VPSGIALLNDLDLGVPILPALLFLVSRDDENIVRVVGNLRGALDVELVILPVRLSWMRYKMYVRERLLAKC
jgi:hypothetical protein